jgi:hypothetical protein
MKRYIQHKNVAFFHEIKKNEHSEVCKLKT